MQFSIKTLLIIQGILAILIYLGRNGALMPIGVVLSLLMWLALWLFPPIWGTIRIASHKGSDNLFFRAANQANSEEESRAIPEEIAQFLDIVKASGLLTDEQVEDVPNYFSAEEWERLSKEPELVAEQMVQLELLTRWQADLLLHGKYKGFFIHNYKLLKNLGSGRTCSAYLAENRFHKLVVIKVLAANLAKQREEEARFIRRAQLFGLLEHPRFIESHEIDKTDTCHFAVEEYESGLTLQQLVEEQGPLDILTAIKYLAQIADGMERIHHFDLIHRDLRPEFVRLTEEHGLKITGLTLTVSIERAQQEKVDGKSSFFVLPDYLAPELVFDPQSIGPASDIYSLGCIFYYMLSGRVPFSIPLAEKEKAEASADPKTLRVRFHSSAVFDAVMHEHQTASAPSLEPYPKQAEAPVRLIAIYERMMTKSPADRYQDAGLLFKDLEAYLQDVGESVD